MISDYEPDKEGPGGEKEVLQVVLGPRELKRTALDSKAGVAQWEELRLWTMQ